MASVAVGGHFALLVAVDTEGHRDLDERPLRRNLGPGDAGVALGTLQAPHGHVSAVGVEDVVGESKELVELEGLTLG